MQSEETYRFLYHMNTSASYIQFNSPSMKANSMRGRTRLGYRLGEYEKYEIGIAYVLH